MSIGVYRIVTDLCGSSKRSTCMHIDIWQRISRAGITCSKVVWSLTVEYRPG